MTLEGYNFHQMVPNLKVNGMMSLNTYQFGLCILLIIIYTSANFSWVTDKNTKITRKLCSNPPKGDGQTSSPNQVHPSKFQNRVWE